ncbi:phosphoribosyltransferase [Archaeoglobus profundus]|uniref:Phosphoribosyltransferase n=1 Tax=Archaeoglobus profundus (strain DSM 5631 / JCM 9629 / NBRC 100127 / Av18) TaxID=572546 RepID=D2RD75_ARCPA|nr:phosphoribosyltransferase [Archaeoglobus profundus]ADB58069.1 phosphoribosyltransferase [Archaeoglobus profundus DSM 5631]
MRCVITNWDYLDSLCRKVAEQIMEDGFEPDTIVAIARGGWFVGSVLCDALGLDELVSLGIKHYIGYDRGELKVRGEISLEYRERVLIVDDLVNTGKSMTKAKEIVEKNAKEVRTACLLLVSTSKFVPNYFGEYLERFSWVIFPWNIVEDLSSLIRAVMKNKELWTVWEIKNAIYDEFQIDPIYLDIINPGRFESVLRVMEMRDVIEKVVVDDKTYYRLK